MKKYILYLLMGLCSGLYAQNDKRMIEVTLPKGTEKRAAVIFANQDYKDDSYDLQKTYNDADDIKAALEKLGFTVLVFKKDLPRTDLDRAIWALENQLRGYSVVFFYYTGHGAEYNGENFFMPTDMPPLEYNSDIKTHGISLNNVYEVLGKAQVRTSIVVSDACRSLPMGKGILSNGWVIPKDAPAGTFTMFAASSGKNAQENLKGRNGYFTQELVKNLAIPDLSINEIYYKTKAAVQQATQQRQRPSVVDELTGKFVFVQTGNIPPPTLPPVLRSGMTKDLPYGPRMVYVGGGSYMMGSNDGEANEKPVHEVQVEDFWIAQTEVTVGQYLEFCEATNSHWPEWLEKGSRYHVKTGSDKYYANKGYTRTASNLPIAGVSWDDAVAYCDWLKSKTGLGYRLPTEAEWEYAARGGTLSNGTAYAGSTDLNAVAWTDGNAGGKPHNVATKSANELGLYDMSGNLWEWCSDWWGNYSSQSQTNPAGPPTGSNRVLRGGSWDYHPRRSRVASRSSYGPSSRLNFIGLRLVSPQ